MKIFKKEKIGKRRIFYLFNKKILSYHKRISATGDDEYVLKAKYFCLCGLRTLR